MANDLHDALLAVTAGIEAALADSTIDVDDHPGRFSDEELKRVVRKRRAVRVAIEKLPQMSVTGPGKVRVSLLFSAVVVCADTPGASRHHSALTITQAIVEALPHQRWNTDYLGPVLPQSIRADNLYSGAIDNQGVAMWGVSWQQTFTNQ